MKKIKKYEFLRYIGDYHIENYRCGQTDWVA